MRPMHGFNNFLSSNSFREPSLGNKWLVALVNYQGKDQIEMIDINRNLIYKTWKNRDWYSIISMNIDLNKIKLILSN